MRKKPKHLTQDERQRVLELVSKGEKFEVIAIAFGVDPSTVVRIAQPHGIKRNDDRIARRTAVKLGVESLILHGMTPKKAAEVAGCTYGLARKIQCKMRKIARGDVWA